MTVTLREAIDRFSIHQPHSPSVMKDGYMARGETVELGSERTLVFRAVRQTFLPIEGTRYFVRKTDIA